MSICLSVYLSVFISLSLSMYIYVYFSTYPHASRLLCGERGSARACLSGFFAALRTTFGDQHMSLTIHACVYIYIYIYIHTYTYV